MNLILVIAIVLFISGMLSREKGDNFSTTFHKGFFNFNFWFIIIIILGIYFNIK
jgi:preprotein translocase subunit SecG